MESISGRFISEVKDFTKERVTQWLVDNQPREFTPERTLPLLVLSALANNRMLTKECAKWLADMLEEELDSILSNRPRYQGSIMWIDELSIYSDAWGLYCRPGTYSI